MFACSEVAPFGYGATSAGVDVLTVKVIVVADAVTTLTVRAALYDYDVDIYTL